MRPRSACAPLFALVAVALPLGADDFQVNTNTTNNQLNPSVASASNGNFVVAWEDQDGDGFGIRGRRFSSSGSPLGATFAVNTYTTGSQTKPAVAVRPTGEFTVVWNGYGAAEQFFGIFGRVFDANGTAQGAQFHVNTYTNSNQLTPRVAYDSFGEMVVVWASTGADDPGTFNTGISARRFDASGGAIGGEFQVNTTTAGDQRYPNLAFQSTGDFVVVWQSYGSAGNDSSAASVQLQRFSSSDSPLGSELQVNTYTTSGQTDPAIGVFGNDQFLVVWDSFGSPGNDSDGSSVQARRFLASGSASGSQFQVNVGTVGHQTNDGEGVAIAADGTTIVAWGEQSGGFPDAGGVRAKLLAADGSTLEPEFQANGYTVGIQNLPSVTAAGSGFVVVWQGYAAGEDLFGIRGRTVPVPDPIFSDGFESGNLTAWSSSVP